MHAHIYIYMYIERERDIHIPIRYLQEETASIRLGSGLFANSSN